MKTDLKNKILKLYIAIWLPFFILVLFAFDLIVSIQLTNQAVDKLRNQSYNCQIYTFRALKSIEEKKINEGLQSVANHLVKYMSDTTGQRVQIYNMQGLIADSSEIDDFPRTKDVKIGLGTKSYVVFWNQGKKYISMSCPILTNDYEKNKEMVGAIRFIYPMNQECIFLFQVISFTVLLAIMMILLNSVLTKKMAGKITKSVNELIESVGYIQNGILDREVKICSGDEMEELGRAINMMQTRLKENMDQLDLQGKQIQIFFNNAAHQLKTPLTSIIGYSQIIQVSNDLDEICEDAFVIEEAGEQLLKSIESIISDSKRNVVEHAPLHIEKFGISELVDESIRIMRPRFSKLGIFVKNACEEKYVLQSDKEIIKEVILTLLDNAVKHSNCSEICIDADQGMENETKVYIRDNGCGIQKEDRKYIFKAFYQPQSSVGKGSGLGLSICVSKMERINGKIDIKEEQFDGAEFILTIPKYTL